VQILLAWIRRVAVFESFVPKLGGGDGKKKVVLTKHDREAVKLWDGGKQRSKQI